jgi:hypothetical protein
MVLPDLSEQERRQQPVDVVLGLGRLIRDGRGAVHGGLQQRVNGFFVAAGGDRPEMRRGGKRRLPGTKQVASAAAVQFGPLGRADVGVDRVAHKRVREVDARLAAGEQPVVGRLAPYQAI